MADDVIQSKLVLDLSALTAQIQQVEQRQQVADTRTEAVVRRVQVAEREVRNVDALANRLQAKITSLGKTLFRQGLGAAVIGGLDALDLGDDPFMNYGKNILVSGVAGAVFSGGNLGVAGIAALGTAVVGLKGLVNDLQQRQRDMEKRLLDRMTALSEERIAIMREQQQFRDDVNATITSARAKEAENFGELMHQAAALEDTEN